jgi:hypothetical protein
MNGKETIYHSNDDFIEKIAHETAMASAIAEFNKAFQCDMIKPIGILSVYGKEPL